MHEYFNDSISGLHVSPNWCNIAKLCIVSMRRNEQYHRMVVTMETLVQKYRDILLCFKQMNYQ